MPLKALRHLKGFWALKHSRYLDNWAFKVLEGSSRHLKRTQGTLKATWALETLKGHLGTQTHQHLAMQASGYLGTQKTLKHLGTGGTQGTLFGRPLLDVSRASTIALAGIHAGDYDHPYLYFSQAPGQFLPCYSFCFVHLGIFHNIGWSAIRLLLPVLEVACSLLIIKLMVRLYFWIFSGFL